MHNNELITIRFNASPREIIELEIEGYTLIRHISTDCYEALVTDQFQFRDRLNLVRLRVS